MKPKLKVCGINDAAFAAEAARCGVDYLGLIFAAKSPRRVTLSDAKKIRGSALGGGADFSAAMGGPKFVGVFIDTPVDVIVRMAESVPLDVVQLHGPYTDEDIDRLRRICRTPLEVWRLLGETPGAEDAVLLDGRDGARTGGTGRRADWSLVPQLKQRGFKVVLAGGLSAENILEATMSGADILDVNSSLETSPGVKSTVLLARLVNSLSTQLAK